MLSRFKEVLPEGVEVILLGDRGFADQKFFRFLEEELQFKYIIRIKATMTIIGTEKKAKARDWLRADGRIFSLSNANITLNEYAVTQFVVVQDKGMKARWVLVSNTDFRPRATVNKYSKRWKIEPYFRDHKDERYRWGLERTHIKSCARRDRLMLILSLSYRLLVILGEAGETIGFDEKLKVNTVKKRTHSIFRQGQFYCKFFFRFTQEEQTNLMDKFTELLKQYEFWGDLLCD